MTQASTGTKRYHRDSVLRRWTLARNII